MTGAPAPVRSWGPAAFAALALALAAALPPLPASRPVPRYQVTFDVSQSMDVEDVAVAGAPASRLALAKRAAATLVDALPCGSRLGWSAFVGQRVMTLATPLEVCAHYEALLSSLETIDGRLRWENSSAVGKGLHQSLRAAEALGEGTAVLMFSDGHEAPPLAAGQSGLPKNPPEGVGGALVGVGGDVPVPVPKTDVDGRRVGFWAEGDVVQTSGTGVAEHLSRLRGEHLEALARLAGLGYVRLGEPAELAGALARVHEAERATVPVDFSWVPALLALVAIAWRFAPRARRPRPSHSSAKSATTG